MKNILIIAAFLSLAVVGQTEIIDSENKFVIIVKDNITTPENSQNETEPAEYDYKFDPKKITVNETPKMYKFEAKDGLIIPGINTTTAESVTTDESNYPTPENLVAQQSVAAQNYPTDSVTLPYMYLKFKLCPVPMVDYVSVPPPQNPYMSAQYMYSQQRHPKNMFVQYVEPMREMPNIYEPNFEHTLQLVDQTKMPSYNNEIVGDFQSGKIYKYYQNSPTYSQNYDNGYKTNSDQSVYYTTKDKYTPYQRPSDHGSHYQTILLDQNQHHNQHYPRTNEHFSPPFAQSPNTMHNVYEVLPYVNNAPTYQMVLLDPNQHQAQNYPKFKKHVHTGSYPQGYQVIERSKDNHSPKFLGSKYYGDDGRKNPTPKRMHAGHLEDQKYSHNIELDSSKWYYRNNVQDYKNKNIYKGKNYV